jgi:hypothetical protein
VAVAAVHIKMQHPALVALAVVEQVAIVQVLELQHPVQTELVILAVVVVVLVTNTHLMYQVTAVTAALAS